MTEFLNTEQHELLKFKQLSFSIFMHLNYNNIQWKNNANK